MQDGKWIFTLTLLDFLVSLAGPIAGTSLGASGTLVVIIPNKDGLLICADRRSYDAVRGDVDNDLKISQLTPWATVASTGTSKYLRLPTFSIGFDANKEAQSFVVANGFSPSMAYWSSLATRVETDFNRYASEYPNWKPPIPPDHVLFQMIFAYFLGKDPHVTVIRLLLDGTTWGAEMGQYMGDQLSGQLLLTFGNVAVPLELQHGRDPRFDDLRSQSKMQPFLTGTARAESTTPDGAKTFALWLIQASSERTHLLEHSTDHIGPTADCAMVSRTHGFYWLSSQDH